MTRIYRKVILGHQTDFFKCSDCLDKANEPKMVWESRYVEVVGPGDGNPGVWEETPLDKCDYCGAVDLESQEEMHQWCHDMDQQQWEEDERMWMDHIAPDTHNPQKDDIWEYK